MRDVKPSCMVVGAGRAGNAIARAMYLKGYRFAWIGSLSSADAAKLAGAVGSPEYGSPPQWPPVPDLLLLTVPDSAIEQVAGSIASSVESLTGTVALHLSGALGSDALESLRKKGAAVAAFHPCQTITADADPSVVFDGVCFDMEGDENACTYAGNIAADIGATSVRLSPEKRLLAHCAMTIVSNYTVALFHTAQKILTSSGIPEDISRNMLKPLFERTATNIVRQGTEKALTGPVARGDADIVRRHIDALDSKFPDVGKLYRLLGLQLVEIVRNEERIPPSAVAELSNILSPKTYD